MWYLYMIECEDGSLYTGITQDVTRRFADHQRKLAHYTSYKLAQRILYTEEFGTKSEAKNRELQIKGWTRAKKLALAEGNRKLLKSL